MLSKTYIHRLNLKLNTLKFKSFIKIHWHNLFGQLLLIPSLKKTQAEDDVDSVCRVSNKKIPEIYNKQIQLIHLFPMRSFSTS